MTNPSTSSGRSLVDRRVAALRKARPELGTAIDLQEQLIRLGLEEVRPPLVEAFPLARHRVLLKVREGQPLLHGEPASVDIHYAADLFSRLVNQLTERDNPDVQERLGPIVAAATSGELDPERLFTEAFVQHHDHLAQLATAAGLDPDLLALLASRAVAPLLREYAGRLLPVLDSVDCAGGAPDCVSWTRGYCPICGGWPLLGELRGVELALHLRCAACGTGWRAQRLECAYCGNTDFHQLGSLQIEGEQRFRVSTCERCKGYLKVGNAFDPPPSELVPLDDVASVHLDIAAIERGYHRPTGTGFRLEIALPDAEWIDELA
jgi:FdhE protein